MEEIDQSAHRVRLVGKGDDTKGRGAASATMVFTVVEEGPAASRVNAVTDLSLSGAVAQYGRGAGLLKSVADQVVSQFAENLKLDITAGTAAGAGGAAATSDTLVGGDAKPKPISGLSLFARALLAWIGGFFGRR